MGTWQSNEAQPLSAGSLDALFSNRIPAIRIPGFANPVECRAFADSYALRGAATAIDAADRGFHVILASDAVANLDPGSAAATQILFGRVWGYVMTTDDILSWMTSGQPPQRTRRPATGRD